MLTLYQFPISHFCEIARWALDFKKIEYRKVNLLPGSHIRVVTRFAPNSSVPVLQHGQKYIQNAGDIITYLDREFPQSPLTPVNSGEKQAALEWERFLHREVGVHLRRYFYHHLLRSPRIVIPLWAQDGAFLAYWRLWLIYPVLSRKMRQYMDINKTTAEKSRMAVAKAIDRLEQAHEDSRFLVGGRFGRADLTAASLLAPILQPASFGLKWPDQWPRPLQEFIDEQAGRLNWAEDLYRNYRTGLPGK